MTSKGSVAQHSKRPLLLVSVRAAYEADEALAGGADWIDLKEPLHGPLGAVSAATARDVAAVVGDSVPLSAAAGELLDWPTGKSRELLAVPELSFIKLGLAGCGGADWQPAWRAALADIAAAGKQLIPVAYADHAAAEAPLPAAVLELATAAASRWILLDTYDKHGGRLSDHLAPPALAAWLTKARSAFCGTAIAGQLDGAAIRELPMNLIGIVAVRGAVCDGPRTARVSRGRVAELLRLMSLVGAPQTREVGANEVFLATHNPRNW